MRSVASSQAMHTATRKLAIIMNAPKALPAAAIPGVPVRAFAPRRRRPRNRPSAVAARSPQASSISLLSLGLVVSVSLLLSLLACTFIVTGLAVWVANGAAEWLAAAVPALLAGLLFAFAWRMAALLQWRKP